MPKGKGRRSRSGEEDKTVVTPTGLGRKEARKVRRKEGRKEGRGRFGILKGDRRGDGGVGVITENGRAFAAITGTTVRKQSRARRAHWVDHLLDNGSFRGSVQGRRPVL